MKTFTDVLSGDAAFSAQAADCSAWLREIPDKSVDLV